MNEQPENIIYKQTTNGLQNPFERLVIPRLHLVKKDVLEGLKEIESETVDLIFADPPFNVGKKYGVGGDRRVDYYEWCEKWISECFRVLKPSGVFCLMTISKHLGKTYPMMENRGVFINQVTWRNVSASRAPRGFWNSYQPIIIYGKTQGYKFNIYAETRLIEKKNLRWGGYSTEPKGQLLDSWDDIPFVYAGSITHKEAILINGTKKKAHPCQMPEMLVARCIKFFTDETDTVLDPFVGSGTTFLAGKKLNRNVIGIEREVEYWKLIENRLEASEPLMQASV